jgi:hypothetical protein
LNNREGLSTFGLHKNKKQFMKQELITSGRVELTREEVVEAVMGYADKNKKLTSAIDAWLSTKHNLSSVRIRYHKDTGGISRAVADVKQKVNTGTVTKFADDPKATRKNGGGFSRKNTGIFKFLKDYLDTERARGVHKVTLKDVKEIVMSNFPHMTDNYLSIYLHDRRMLPDIKKVDREGGVIEF